MPRRKLEVKRDKNVGVYLLENEKDYIENRAKKIGVSVAAYVRMLILADMANNPGDSPASKKRARTE
jgi:hypothetical protein